MSGLIIDALARERELPPVTLLLGPDVAGMERSAVASLRSRGVIPADLVVDRKLTALSARDLVAHAGVASFGPFRVAVIWMDGSTEQAQHILLKVLEEPPPPLRFILVASSLPLPTIVSRCQVVTVPAPERHLEPDGKVAAQVSAALKAAEAGDLLALDIAMTGWGDAHRARLEEILAAAAVKTWETGGSGDVTSRQARRLLGALGRLGAAHPRLAAHAVLAAESERKHHEH